MAAPGLEKLIVVTMISNPVRFDRRYELYQQFKAHMAESGVDLYTVEVAIGDMPFVVTAADDPFSLQLRSWDELWHKENGISLLVQHITRIRPDWEFVAWLDADIYFPSHVASSKHNWARETVARLNTYNLVQLFVNAVDLGPNGEVYPGQLHTSFGYRYTMGQMPGTSYSPFMHPGYAWAMRRDAWDACGGGLKGVDYAILGSGDHHFATAFVGKVNVSIHGKMGAPYFDRLRAFENVVVRACRKDMGFVPGTIVHYFHGSKSARNYVGRWDILANNKFDPTWDLMRDSQGLYALVDHGDQRSIVLRDQIRGYFRARNEDAREI
jgi:hypothetical protein